MLISACLLGVQCRYDGGGQILPTLDRLMERYELIPVCPEQLGGLPTPRTPAERQGGRVVDREGRDVTDAFSRGADQACHIARLYGARLALLKARSPSCGCTEIYDGSFSGRKIPGSGIAAERLTAMGVSVYTEADAQALIQRNLLELTRRTTKEESAVEKNYRAELVGVLGDPVDGNPTGVMEEAGFAHDGLNWRYITVKVLPDDLDAAMAGVRAFNMRGVNLTMPHKINVLKHMDALSEAARVIGAVNTVICREDGTLFGENTDGKGFVQSLTDAGIPLKGKSVCLLGAGGAARSIGVECALAGAASVTVINRSKPRGEALAAVIRENTEAEARYIPWEGPARVPDGVGILINATSVGLHPHGNECPDVDFDTVQPGMVACDVIFNPVDTPFLTRAAARGARTIDGLGMLVNQGAINYTLWTGRKAPRDVMYAKLKSEFGM